MTPLDVHRFHELLRESGYCPKETAFLIEGFTLGFDIGYEGPKVRRSRSHNIPFSVGNKQELWAKVMSEVEAKRYAGPFEEIPFENFIQSPIGLVPKAGNKTRLIFHLSYDFAESEEGGSVNKCTPKEKCSVRYNDLDTAVKQCILVSEQAEICNIDGKRVIFLGKTDLFSAFRVLPLRKDCFQWLVLMAEDPKDGKFKFLIDKCLPFGALISCSHYQRFSNALRHILESKTQQKTIVNYLDDFLFIAYLHSLCNSMIL